MRARSVPMPRPDFIPSADARRFPARPCCWPAMQTPRACANDRLLDGAIRRLAIACGLVLVRTVGDNHAQPHRAAPPVAGAQGAAGRAAIALARREGQIILP